MTQVNKTQVQAKYEKLFTALKYYMIGKNYTTALSALEFARSFHTGFRKNGIDPEYLHQVSIALYTSSLKGVQNEEMVLALSCLHDTPEDYDVDKSILVNRFGEELTRKTLILSKKYQGREKTMSEYFGEIGDDIDCSIVKGADRVNNVQTMIGVFSEEKQKKYIKEVEELFLPMLKTAKKNFPTQTHAYFNISQMLKNQVELVKAIHDKK